jgi:hypothetical protein
MLDRLLLTSICCCKQDAKGILTSIAYTCGGWQLPYLAATPSGPPPQPCGSNSRVSWHIKQAWQPSSGTPWHLLWA